LKRQRLAFSGQDRKGKNVQKYLKILDADFTEKYSHRGHPASLKELRRAGREHREKSIEVKENRPKKHLFWSS